MKWYKLLTTKSAHIYHNTNVKPEKNNENFFCTNISSLSKGKFETIDPEEFFHDPDHVRHYKDEAMFLQMMSDWVIIDYPIQGPNYQNFFLGDNDDEMITKSLQIQNNKVEIIQDCKYNNRIIDIYHYLFGHKIENGILINHYNDLLNNVYEIHKCQNDHKSDLKENNHSEIDKNVNTKFIKTKATNRSINGAIVKCPFDLITCNYKNADDYSESQECQHVPNQINHFEINQYFCLDDSGNILLNINHIREQKGHEVFKKRFKRIFHSILTAEIIDESYTVRQSKIKIVKDVVLYIWNTIFCGHPRNKVNQIGGPGNSVKAYTMQLAEDKTSTFSRNIENFISCTKESREAAPQVVMRNMRQFMSGMKNYLVKHGEADFHQEVQKARSQLKADEFLNLDHILETVMHQLVVLPLREHLYGLFVDYYTRSGDIQLLVENVKYACARNPIDFGIRTTISPPTFAALNQISNLLLRLQEAEAPLDKLDLFLCVISVVFEATGCQRGQQLGADDFLPVLVYVVAKCGFIGAEIEAEFMWGLLQPALLSGEASYYLTSLCSAVHVLKSFMASDNEGTGSLDWRSSSLPACSSVLRVIIPDEYNGSLQTRTLPVRPHTTTKEVCRIIAHKARITNPQDYGLFKLVDGEETILVETECPQDARIAARGKHCMLAYKRIDAKIAWPTAPQPPYT